MFAALIMGGDRRVTRRSVELVRCRISRGIMVRAAFQHPALAVALPVAAHPQGIRVNLCGTADLWCTYRPHRLRTRPQRWRLSRLSRIAGAFRCQPGAPDPVRDASRALCRRLSAGADAGGVPCGAGLSIMGSMPGSTVWAIPYPGRTRRSGTPRRCRCRAGRCDLVIWRQDLPHGAVPIALCDPAVGPVFDLLFARQVLVRDR